MTNQEIDGPKIVSDVLAGLKGFQRKTVDHVYRRMYDDLNPALRFLVADEVGLGKTLVARGLIAKTIQRLQEQRVKRIDVIYICSNADIARQNIQRLNVTGQSDFSLASRITLLPLQLHRLNENGLNFISFTPGTSFNMSSRGGTAQERAVLFHLLKKALGADALEHDGAYRLLRGNKGDARFRGEVAWIGQQTLDKGLSKAFVTELRARPELRKRFGQISRRLRDPDANVDWNTYWNCIRDLRQTLARSCVEALEPDFVILDEFQRFKELLQEPNPDDPDDIRALAHHLFAQKDVRILLLSATPYKMYTLSDESDDDHYKDFLQTTRFLMSKEDAMEFDGELRDFRRALLDFETVGEAGLRRRKHAVERRLRRVMVRTERLAVTADRSGMLADRRVDARLEPNDVRTFAMVDRLSRQLSANDPTDYWKSAPYLLNFMEGYQLKREMKAAHAVDGGVSLAAAIDPDLLLPLETIEAYHALDPGNARLRGVADDLLASDAWRLLWMPPSIPYYEPAGPFAHPAASTLTKRLIFSSWAVVPPAVSAILSYEAERQMMRSRDPEARNDAEARRRLRGLLTLRRVEGEPAGMSTFALLYPSPSLAELGDPLAVARDLGAADRPVSRGALVAAVQRRIEAALTPLTKRSPADGLEDERWYWAAPLLLDRRRDPATTERWLSRSTAFRGLSVGGSIDDEEDGSGWSNHVDRAHQVVQDGIQLGRVPADLASALTGVAIAGLGVCGLRATARVLARVRGLRLDFRAFEARDAGGRISWGLRSLFNVPEVMSLVRGPLGDESVYWRAVLEYSIDGNLQSALDEYAHVLPEWLGLLDRDAPVIAQRMSEAIAEAASIRAVNYGADEIRLRDGGLKIEPLRMRVRFAMRFGADQSDEEKKLQRSGAVRSAFNSPFWPFVLTSTSVGQEGLDFHQYCHAVVHWNLPANPVDLEQREGRVHRYKGHAIRKNVATRHRSAAFGRRVSDPWAAMFDLASRGVTRRDLKDIEPFWVYDGPARIERHVPLIALSREVEHLERLKRSLAVYRMVFGQPRQEDLVAFIGDRIGPEAQEALVEQLRVDLAP
jgi:Helicase conserved C-terminal domain